MRQDKKTKISKNIRALNTIVDVLEGQYKGKRGLTCDGHNSDTPHGLSEFIIIENLFKQKPEWRERFCQVGIVFPRWIPYIDRWQELIEEMEKELDKKPNDFWKLLRDLKDQAFTIEGWKKDAFGGWTLAPEKRKTC